MKQFYLLCCLICSLSLSAQFSKTHYLPPLSGSEFVLSEEQYLYVSTPSVTPVAIRVIYLGGQVINASVSRDAPYVLSMGFVQDNDSQIMTPPSEVAQIRSDKGIIVEADDLIYASIRLIAGNGNQAGELVSKGLAALGTDFRVGAMVNTLMEEHSEVHYTFASILATENNTEVSFSDIGFNASLLNNWSNGSSPFSITLNAGESYVIAVQGPNNANRDALIGMHVTSDKPIVVNCGSFGGTNGEMFNLDLGFDQIVSSERTGRDYIFIKSTGSDPVEKILLIASEDNTEVFLGSNTTPSYTLIAGEYVAIDGTQYGPNGNLFVHTSKNVFAYQSVGDNIRTDQANQELFFVPPLSCETPHVIDNIPLIELVGSRIFTGRITVVTEAGSTLGFTINGQDYSLGALSGLGATVEGPTSVDGNAGFETYIISGLTGNVAVSSTTQLYLACYGSSDAATFGGYFSGFTFRPEISQESLDSASENCLPNLQLSVNELTGFDTFQWFFNNVEIAGATASSYVPTQAGYYFVKGAINSCSTEMESEKLPVSLCAPDTDNDGMNDNLDLDLDNDGLFNCAESYGDINVNLATSTGGNINIGAYANSFSLQFPPGNGAAPTAAYSGFANGNFTTRTTAGEGNSTIMQVTFAQPMAVQLQPPIEDMGADAFNDAAEYRISVPPTHTLSIDDPDHQLLIDTNCDGIFENGVSRHSSFEIRFRLNSGVPITPGSGTFRIRAHEASVVKIMHINLSETANASSLKLVATCVPRDSDGDGIADAEDYDSDNDGIPDLHEVQGAGFVAASGVDSDNDGRDDAFSQIVSGIDSDGDGTPDFLDLDSDNNGVFDIYEGGFGSLDLDFNGTVDATQVGSNGFHDSLETASDSGVASNLPVDTDANGIADYISTDNDGDGCFDTIEAGFDDADNDGRLANSPVSTNAKGVVQSTSGYTIPDAAMQIAAPIDISQQPMALAPLCEGEPAQFGIQVNSGVSVIWEVSVDGVSFAPVNDATLYSGWTTSELSVNAVDFSMNGFQYRAVLSRAGNACGKISDSVTLAVQSPPAVINAQLIQCEPEPVADGISLFNLAQADVYFASGNTAYSVKYFASITDQQAGNELPSVYQNIQNPQQIIAEVTYSDSGCGSLNTLDLLTVSTPLHQLDMMSLCEEQADEDGFRTFDLTSADFGGNISELTFYYNLDDALLEQNDILSPVSYVNSLAYTSETIYVRRENANACLDLYALPITVLPLPLIDGTTDSGPYVICENEPDFTIELEVETTDNSSASAYNFQWILDGELLAGQNAAMISVAEAGTYQVVVTGANGCSKTKEFIVTASSQAIISDVIIHDLQQQNSVEIVLDAASLGDYEYSIGEPDFFQQSPQFSNVAPGIHMIYVKDLNGCALATQEIHILGAPAFFSPNGDGYNDLWLLKGTSAIYNSQASVYIFDRFGKLIKQLAGLSSGWDGTLNGQPLPADDYWYRIVLENGRIATGHFALIR